MLSKPQISLRAKQLLCLAALLPTLAFSQAWPTKQPIKLVAVFPPGGSVDQVSRIIAPVLSQQLGQSVVVENKGGASGVIGTASVLSAPADGYTFAVVFDTHGVNQSLIPNMPYDSKKDIVPLILVGTSAMVLTPMWAMNTKLLPMWWLLPKPKRMFLLAPLATAVWATWPWPCWAKMPTWNSITSPTKVVVL